MNDDLKNAMSIVKRAGYYCVPREDVQILGARDVVQQCDLLRGGVPFERIILSNLARRMAGELANVLTIEQEVCAERFSTSFTARLQIISKVQHDPMVDLIREEQRK